MTWAIVVVIALLIAGGTFWAVIAAMARALAQQLGNDLAMQEVQPAKGRHVVMRYTVTRAPSKATMQLAPRPVPVHLRMARR